MSGEHSEPRSTKRGRGRAAATVELLGHAVDVLDGSRWAMTLRHLHYVLVSRADAGLLAGYDKSDRSYNRLKRVMRDAREDGTVPWSRLVDHARVVDAVRTFDGIRGLLDDAQRFYRADLMRQQPVTIQIWAESDSVGSVVAQVARRYTIPTFIGRGYTSRGYVMDAARDIVAAGRAGKGVVILHVGDHDPSGEDIFRDLEETLRLYVVSADFGQPVAHCRRGMSRVDVEDATDWVTIERIALTPDQIADYGLPYRPVKTSDSRAGSFTGRGAVEVEALPVDALLGIVEDEIESWIDPAALETAKLAEQSEREIMHRIAGTPIERLLEVAS